MNVPRIWHDGSLVESNPQLLAPALHYGLGVFEGIRSYQTPAGPAIFRLDLHLDRMAEGARALGMAFDPEATATGCREVLRD